MANEYFIGDTVKIKEYTDIPSEKKLKSACGDPSIITPRKSALCGKTVEIVDKLYSEQYETYLYRVKEEGSSKPSKSEFTSDLLAPINADVKYSCEVIDGENVIVACVYEERRGEKTLVAKGHGHVIHEGALGFTQALSYALKRAYQRLQDESSGVKDEGRSNRR